MKENPLPLLIWVDEGLWLKVMLAIMGLKITLQKIN